MKKLIKVMAMFLLVATISMTAVNSFAEDATGEAVLPATVEQIESEPTVNEQPASTQEPTVTEQPAPTQETTVTEQPAETAATEAEATPTATVEASQEPLVNEISAPDLSNVSITTHFVANGTLQYGDSITVAAQIAGLDGIAYGMQWQYFDGTEWQDQAGANDSSYSFTLTTTNAIYLWRMVVTVD